jgi:hypothetical protein
MGRPAKQKWRSPEEIKAAIVEEVAQHDLLQRDLRDALVAGEDSRPYRQAIAETGEKIAKLRATLAGLEAAEAERRRAFAASTAAEIAAESHRRHVDLLARLDAPVFPKICEGFSHASTP